MNSRFPYCSSVKQLTSVLSVKVKILNWLRENQLASLNIKKEIGTNSPLDFF